MKTDLYTKSILTVIAIALIALVFKNNSLLNEAKADKTNFNKFASVPINDDGSINVKMVSDMDVNIRSIGGSSVYGTLPINLKEVSGSSVNGYLPINLKAIDGSSVSSSSGIPVNIKAVNGSSIYNAIPVKQSN
jgi:hypothetical protein